MSEETPSLWTTQMDCRKNDIPNEYYLMFLAASTFKLHITSAYVHPVRPLATILNNCTWNKQLLNTKFQVSRSKLLKKY